MNSGQILVKTSCFFFIVQCCDLSHKKKRLLQDYLNSGAKIDRRNKQKTRQITAFNSKNKEEA